MQRVAVILLCSIIGITYILTMTGCGFKQGTSIARVEDKSKDKLMPKYIDKSLVGVSLNDKTEKLIKVLGETKSYYSNFLLYTRTYYYYDKEQDVYLEFNEQLEHYDPDEDIHYEYRKEDENEGYLLQNRFFHFLMTRDGKQYYDQQLKPDDSKVYNPKPKKSKIKIEYKEVNLGEKLKTGKGIKLGDEISKIVKIYGNPHRVYKKGDNLVYEYISEDERFVTAIYTLTLTFKNSELITWEVYEGS